MPTLARQYRIAAALAVDPRFAGLALAAFKLAFALGTGLFELPAPHDQLFFACRTRLFATPMRVPRHVLGSGLALQCRLHLLLPHPHGMRRLAMEVRGTLGLTDHRHRPSGASHSPLPGAKSSSTAGTASEPTHAAATHFAGRAG